MVTSHEIPMFKKRSWINRQSLGEKSDPFFQQLAAGRPPHDQQDNVPERWLDGAALHGALKEAIIPQSNYLRSRGHGFAPLKSSYAIFCCWRCSKMKQVDETGKKHITDSAHPSFWSTTFLQQRTKSVEIPREPLADPQQENQHFQGLPDVKAIQVSWEEWPAPVTTYPSVPPLPPPTSWWRPRTAPNIGKTWLE